MAGVDGGRLERRELAFSGGEIERGDLGFEALRSDAVNRAGASLVQVRVTTGARIEPIADVDGTVGTDADVGGAEEGMLFDGEIVVASDEVRALELARGVRGAEVGAIELESGSTAGGLVSEDRVSARFATQEEAFPVLAKGAVFIKRHARGSATAVDIACGDAAWIILPPFGFRNRLSGAFVGTPSAEAVPGEEAETAALDDVAHAARRWVVVVILKMVAEGGDDGLKGVPVVEAEDAGGGAVGIDAGGEPSDINVAVIAGLAGVGVVHVRAADAEGLAAAIGELGSAIPIGEIPATIGTGVDGVKAVIVLGFFKAGEKDLTRVDLGIKLQVAIHIRVDDEVGRVRDDDDVIENGDTEGTFEAGFTNKNVAGVGLAVAIGVFQNADAVALAGTAGVTAVVDALGDPNAALGVHVHVRGVEKHGRRGPNRNLKTVGDGERFGRDEIGGDRGGLESRNRRIRDESRLAGNEFFGCRSPRERSDRQSEDGGKNEGFGHGKGGNEMSKMDLAVFGRKDSTWAQGFNPKDPWTRAGAADPV